MFGANKHIAFLEKELAACRDQGAAQVATLKSEHREEIKSLREDHRKELEYARTEMARLQVEVDRLLLQITTGRTQINALEPVDSEEGMKKLRETLSSTSMGTAWQRILAAEGKKREAVDAAKRNARPAQPHEETSNGRS